MPRISLQPIRRFALLAVAAHVLVIGLLWWWLSHTGTTTQKPAASESLTWLSPADFSTSPALEPTAAQVKPAPSPTPPPVAAKSKPEPAPQPKPAPDNNIKSMLAVVSTAPAVPQPAPALPPPPSVPSLPKAIAIDPAQAIALMKAQEEEQAKKSAPSAPSAPEPAAAPQPAVAKSDPPAAPDAAKSEPPAAPPKSQPPPVIPSAPVSEVSRFITVSSRSPAGAGDKSVRLEEVDRAIRDAFMIQWMPPKTQGLNINQRTAHMNMTVDRAGHVLGFTIVKLSGSEAFDHSLREAANRLETIPATLPDSYRPDQYEFQLHFHVE